jgi:hypothetical protein
MRTLASPGKYQHQPDMGAAIVVLKIIEALH